MAHGRMIPNRIRRTGQRLAVYTFDRDDVLEIVAHVRAAPHHAGDPTIVFELATHAALFSTGRSKPRAGLRWPAERIAYAYQDGDHDTLALVMGANGGDFRASWLPEDAEAAANEAIATVGVVIYDESPPGANLVPDPEPS